MSTPRTYTEMAAHIKSIRFGVPGKVHFNYMGREVAIKEPRDIMLVGSCGAALWIARAYGSLLAVFPIIDARPRFRVTARNRTRAK